MGQAQRAVTAALACLVVWLALQSKFRRDILSIELPLKLSSTIERISLLIFFTAVLALATIGLGAIPIFGFRNQSRETRVIQRAYLSVEPNGIEWTNKANLVGQVVSRNVGRLPATDFVSVVKKIEVRNDQWITPTLTNADLPSGTTGVIPIGAEIPRRTA